MGKQNLTTKNQKLTPKCHSEPHTFLCHCDPIRGSNLGSEKVRDKLREESLIDPSGVALRLRPEGFEPEGMTTSQSTDPNRSKEV
jgi:hypothetical protein